MNYTVLFVVHILFILWRHEGGLFISTAAMCVNTVTWTKHMKGGNKEKEKRMEARK
jgi:hypothetical protein